MTLNPDELIIESFRSEYAAAFKALNKAWIDKYFVMESSDYETLDYPEKIIRKGGEILFISHNNTPIAVCALICKDEKNKIFELAKMAVDPNYQGQGLGYRIGHEIIKLAKELNASSLFLESNTILEPAINLYRKLGFKEVKNFNSPYERSNIKMELTL